MNEFQAVILAAGEGKRMKSEKSKLVFTICEKPLISWVTRAARQAGAGEVTVVVGHKKEQVMEALSGETVNFAVQEVPQGTGHAVMMARPFFENREGAVLVLNGDAPLVSPETIKEALAHHSQSGAAVTVLSSYNPNPKGYGRIVKDEAQNVLKIVEEKDATDEERKICEVNSGMYVFDAKKLCAALSGLTNDNAQKEYYLTDTVAVLRAAGERVSSFIVCDEKETWGVNDRVQLACAQKALQRKINERIALSGVTITDLDHTYIGPDVTVGRDSEILPGTILEGKTVIGENCIIGPNTRLSDMTVGDGCEVMQSVGIQSTIGKNNHVGPFAYIRPGCCVGDGCKIGDFVELKNAQIGNGTKAAHLTYIGDATVGDGVNFGCGTVVVNYDGTKKYRTVIEDGAFIGCNSNLVSPVTVKKGAYTAAGSTITDEVPENALAIARARQVNKENWKDRRGENK